MESRTILMVEDDVGLSTMLTFALEDARYIVQHATNGAEALEALSSSWPSLILLDLRMPVMDGPTFLRTASERYGQRLPPVIIMTAYHDLDAEVVKLGLPTINKPMQIDRLLTLIASQTATS